LTKLNLKCINWEWEMGNGKWGNGNGKWELGIEIDSGN
jgi:hypothetical protein